MKSKINPTLKLSTDSLNQYNHTYTHLIHNNKNPKTTVLNIL